MPIPLEIPGWESNAELRHLVLDLNGTLALDGVLLPGVAERIAALRPQLHIHLLTANTHGAAEALADSLGIGRHLLKPGAGSAQKQAFVEALGAESVVAMGNGRNDAAMLDVARIGIAVIGREGASTAALNAADLVVGDINDGLDLLLHPRRLLASLRG